MCVSIWSETTTNFVNNLKNHNYTEQIIEIGGIQISSCKDKGHPDTIYVDSFDDSIIMVKMSFN